MDNGYEMKPLLIFIIAEIASFLNFPSIPEAIEWGLRILVLALTVTYYLKKIFEKRKKKEG